MASWPALEELKQKPAKLMWMELMPIQRMRATKAMKSTLRSDYCDSATGRIAFDIDIDIQGIKTTDSMTKLQMKRAKKSSLNAEFFL